MRDETSIGAPSPSEWRLQVLLFHLDQVRFAVPVLDVRHVLRATAVTSLPGSPGVVMGVVDVEGDLVPVFSLRRRVGLPEREISPDDQFVLARAGERTVLLHVDRADRVAVVDPGDLHSPVSVVAGLEHVAGIARVEDGLVLIHDLHGFLSQAEAYELDAALGMSRP